jgi:chitinase
VCITIDINGAWAPLTGPNAPFNAEQDKGANFSFANSKLCAKLHGLQVLTSSLCVCVVLQ